VDFQEHLMWPFKALAELIDHTQRIRRAVVNEIPARLREMESRMANREQAAYENLSATIQSVRDGWTALVAERDQYKAALEAADADEAAAVAAALEADSEYDAEKIETADAQLAELVAQPPAPVEGGGEPAPVEGGDQGDGSTVVVNPTDNPDEAGAVEGEPRP
jgi:hypothetical protein